MTFQINDSYNRKMISFKLISIRSTFLLVKLEFSGKIGKFLILLYLTGKFTPIINQNKLVAFS